MKKAVGLALVLVLTIVLLLPLTITVSAAGDSITTADEISFDSTCYGSITDSSKKDVYRFTLNSAGCVTINMTAYITGTHYYLHDENGNEIWNDLYRYWNETTQVFKSTFSLDLTKGTYYFSITQCSGTGDYNFRTTFKTASETYSEAQGGSNNAISEADTITLGKTNKGQLAVNDNKDLYKFTLTNAGRVTVDMTAYITGTHYHLYDENGNEIWDEPYRYWNETTQVYKTTWALDLVKGTYYFAISQCSGTGNYTLKTTFKTASESFSETQNDKNNSITDADGISLSKTYTGQIAINDEKDLYKFSVKKNTTVILNVTAYITATHYYLYDENGNEIWSALYRYWNETTGKMVLTQEFSLKEGTYYFAVGKNSGAGNYKFSLKCNHTWKTSSVTKATLSANGKVHKKCSICGSTTSVVTKYPSSFKLSATTYTYNGSLKTPSVTVKDTSGNVLKKDTDYTVTYASGRKSVGNYTVIVKMKGNYSGTKTLSFKINPLNISKCTTKLSTTGYTYNGAVRTPSVTVKNANGITLTKNTHYTVTYAGGRKNVGTYKVTVKMKGNYTGTKTLTFKISPAKLRSYKLSTVTYAYNGKLKTPSVVVKNANGTTMTKNTHYSVTYASGRRNVGTYKVTIKGKGNYSGTRILTFKIIPAKTSISKVTSASKSLKISITKKTVQTTGYQVQYSTSKSFKSPKVKTVTSYKTTNTTLTGLKAKTTYYVRVRTYKTVKGTTYYSGWSTFKSGKTK